MRLLIIQKHTSLAAVGKDLLKSRTRSTALPLERLQAANPHLDPKNIRAGSVLLIPDAPEFKTSASDPAGGDSLAELAQHLGTAVGAGGQTVLDALANRGEQAKAVTKALGSATVKKLAADDSVLRGRVDAASARIAANAKAAAQIRTQVETLQAGVAADLKTLQALLR
ncbi:LysM peptidoglycan-binding domain-containing protein [Dyella ginsengisoli]|uniref:LysM peptidoglycan-binding domain-containing protein n=1 Tax=Dyella ginsengisoli TaxID=363848 RepID=UPI0003473BCA|nr:LysM peptidoglycan-binding domain-containing protein [Dyella ginsengisoli]